MRFLKKFCAPRARATEKRPSPAIIEAASTPQSSSTLTIPIKYATNLKALNIHALRVNERKLYLSPIKSLSGSAALATDQKIAM